MTRLDLRPKAYPVLVDAIESGVRYGYRRAHKHDPKPSEDVIIDHIERAVIGEICERFHMPEEE